MEFLAVNINTPYIVLSDIHFHNWSEASIIKDGINSRLKDIINSFEQACQHLKKTGGRDVVFCGDLFHTRGRIEPSVFNPVFEMFKNLTELGFRFFCIPGNHDLETQNSNDINNAFSSFSKLNNFFIFNKPTKINNFYFIPWFESVSQVKAVVSDLRVDAKDCSLVLHTPLNDVIKSIPNIGIEPEFLKRKGFKYVFCGHYHQHVCHYESIYSVGALCHQTWGDVGTLAGYILVSETGVEHFETNSPKFIDFIDFNTDYKNHYVKISGVYTEEEIETIKKFLKERCLYVKDVSTVKAQLENVYYKVDSQQTISQNFLEYLNKQNLDKKLIEKAMSYL